MENTYGFIESWLADAFGITDTLEYPLESGQLVLVIDTDTFFRIRNEMVKLWKLSGDNSSLKPIACSSVVQGMSVLLHKYWMNDDILNELTGAEVKSAPIYNSVVGLGPSGVRFVMADVLNQLNAIINPPPEPDTADAPNADVAVESTDTPEDSTESDANKAAKKSEKAEKPKEPELTEEQQQIKDLMSHIKNVGGEYETAINHIIDNGLQVITIGESLSAKHREMLRNIALKLNKNIVIARSANFVYHIINKLNSKFNLSQIEKHTLFFVMNPEQYNEFTKSIGLNALCLGYTVNNIFTVNGKDSLNNDLAKTRCDSSLDKKARERKVAKLLRSRKNTPFYKYDCIFKDTITNVIWGLKDRSLIHFTIPYKSRSHDLYTILFDELLQRYDKKVSYNELKVIDQAYMDKMYKSNEDEYVDFAIANSRAIIDGLKIKRDEYHKKYNEHFDKAMEAAKMYDKFRTQVDYFDETKFQEDERNKAMATYNETLDIDRINAILVKDNAIHVYTNNIYAQDERNKHWHDIGTFHITLGMHNNTYDTENTLRIKNTKHQINGYNNNMQAPHVYEDGRLCHGNLAAGLIDAYKRRDLFELIYQILIFLQSANTSDPAGQHVDKWPEVSEEVALNKMHDAQNEYEILSQLNEADKEFDKKLNDAIPVTI